MSEPTNKELAEEIKTLSAQLGVEVSLATNKAQLLEQLEGLRKQLAERTDGLLGGGAHRRPEQDEDDEDDEDDDGANSARAPDPTPAATRLEPEPRAYKVGPTGALTTKRGLLAPGAPIQPDDVPGGIRRLEDLVRAGVLVRS